MFYWKIHYKWLFSIAMFVYQRVFDVLVTSLPALSVNIDTVGSSRRCPPRKPQIEQEDPSRHEIMKLHTVTGVESNSG